MNRSRLIMTGAALVVLCGTVPTLAQRSQPTKKDQPTKAAPMSKQEALRQSNGGKDQPNSKAQPGKADDAHAQPEPPKGQANQPRTDLPITFDEGAHDFGAIFDTAPVSHVFRFTNTSDSAVKIKGVRATCGCTTPQLTKTLYQPGESGEISVTFNPHGRAGEQHKSIRVSFEEPKIADAQLEITSYVKPLVVTDPIKTSLPSVKRGVGETSLIHVSGRRSDFAITNVEADNNFVSTKVLDPEVVEQFGDNMVQYPIEITVSPDAPLGRIICNVRITTNEPDAQVQSHTFIANVEGDLRATPDRLSLRLRGLGSPFTQSVRLQAREGQDFQVTGLSLMGMEGMGAVVDLSPIELSDGRIEYLVTVAGTGPRQHGPFSGTLVVQTTLEDSAEMQIPLSGVVMRDTTPTSIGGTARPTTTTDKVIRPTVKQK